MLKILRLFISTIMYIYFEIFYHVCIRAIIPNVIIINYVHKWYRIEKHEQKIFEWNWWVGHLTWGPWDSRNVNLTWNMKWNSSINTHTILLYIMQSSLFSQSTKIIYIYNKFLHQQLVFVVFYTYSIIIYSINYAIEHMHIFIYNICFINCIKK